MNESNMIKKDLLSRKIKEYFSKNPQAKSVIVKANMGKVNTIWSVVKEENNYNIVEVNTSKEVFLLEQDDAKKDDKNKPDQTQKPKRPPLAYLSDQDPKTKADNPELKPSQEKEKIRQKRQATAALKQSQPMTPSTPKSSSLGNFFRPKPEPMDDPNAVKNVPLHPELQSINKWNPMGTSQDSEFGKELQRSKSFQSAVMKMPQGDFVRYFKPFGTDSKSKLNPDILRKAKDFYAQHNPLIAKVNENFILEASLEYSNLSRQFVQAMTPPFDHVKLSNVLKSANSSLPRIVDPKEKNEVGAMIGALTNMVDTTTAGGGKVQVRSSPITTTKITSSKKVFGSILREDEDSKKKDNKESGLKKVSKKEPDKPSQKIEPTEEPDDDVGIETNTDLEDSQSQLPIQQPSSEEMAISKALTGQTIKAANIKLTPSGGELTLDLVSAAVPAKLEWSKTGKVVFYFNDRPYVLKRE